MSTAACVYTQPATTALRASRKRPTMHPDLPCRNNSMEADLHVFFWSYKHLESSNVLPIVGLNCVTTRLPHDESRAVIHRHHTITTHGSGGDLDPIATEPGRRRPPVP